MIIMLQSIKNYFNKFDRKTSNYILLTLFIIMIVYLMFSLGSQSYKRNDELYMEGFENKLKELMDGGKSKRLEKFREKSNNRTTLKKIVDRFNRVDERFFSDDDHSMDHMKHKIKEYYRSFNQEKFTDTPKNSRHALEKFKHFKESFWNIFKD